MDYIVRKPDFQIEVVRPNYNSSKYVKTPVVKFISSLKQGDPSFSTDLIGYSFSESLATIDSRFSLTLTLAEDENGKTWLDKIKKKDLVFISEFGKARFAGSIEDRRYSARMSSDGKVSRNIAISGVGLGALLMSFQLIIDQFLYAGDTLAEAANKDLMSKLVSIMEKGGKVKNAFIVIYNSFMGLALRMGVTNSTAAGIKTVLDHFIDFNKKLSSDIVFRYPVALSLYNTGENSIWNIVSGLVTPPVNELYGLWNPDTKKYEAVYRQTPFEPDDWKSLTINYIPSILITDHDLGDSTSEVYTYYLGVIPGSGLGSRKIMLLSEAGGTYGSVAEKDKERWKMYGYRPMMVEFKYFNKDKIAEFDVAKLTKELSQMLRRWYERNDEFLSGSMTIMTINDRWWPGKVKSPRIGERIGFLDGEFYAEEVEHSWTYGGPMETQLAVTRGYKYSAAGMMQGPIDNYGKKLSKIAKAYDRYWSNVG